MNRFTLHALFRSSPLLGVVLGVTALMSPVSPLQAQLKVDVGQSVGGTVTPEAGFNGFTANTGATVSNNYTAPFGTGGGGTVAVGITSPFYRSTPSGGYPQVTSQPGFNDLLSGSALMNNTSQTITLDLNNLADGDYAITTFHHANFGSSTGAASVDILLTDINNAGATAHSNVFVTAGATPSAFTTRVTNFSVAGGSTTSLIFDAGGGTSGPEHANLNAFVLTDVSSGIPGLNVDFGSAGNAGGGPGGTQAGFEAFEADGGGSNSRAFASLLGNNGIVNVTASGQLVYRDYAAATGSFAPQSALLSDGLLLNNQGTITLEFDDLADGLYELTTYHHTTQFGPSARPDATPFDVVLTDGNLTDELLLSGLTMSDNASDALSIATIEFEVIGGSPVSIDFIRGPGVGPSTSDHFALAGIELVQATQVVPEPSCLTIWALCAVAIAVFGARRMRP